MGNPRRVHYAGIVAGAFLLSAPATAQQTNCQWIGSTWNCNTKGGGIDWGGFQRQQERNQQMWDNYARTIAEQNRLANEQREAQARAQAEDYREMQRRLLQGEVLQAIRNGDCALAESKALDGGDLALAAQVKDYCRK